MKVLNINACRHGIYSVSIDDAYTGIGFRVTPSEHCGRWETIHSFILSKDEWGRIAQMAALEATPPTPTDKED